MHPTDDSGEVLALLLRLDMATRLVQVPIMLAVIALTLVRSISPIEISVAGPILPKLQTSRVRLLTEQTLRRGGGSTRLTLGPVKCSCVTSLPIPRLGSRLFLLGPVFRVTPTRSILVPIRHLGAMLKCFEVIRPTPECPLALRCVGLLLFLFEPSCLLRWPTVTVSVLRVLGESVLSDTLVELKWCRTVLSGLIVLSGSGAVVASRVRRLCSADGGWFLMRCVQIVQLVQLLAWIECRRSVTMLGPHTRHLLLVMQWHRLFRVTAAVLPYVRLRVCCVLVLSVLKLALLTWFGALGK